MSNPLTPSTPLLCKLGSIIVHADEMLSPDGHQFDGEALKQLICDSDVKKWLADMGEMALVPLKRKIP